MDIGLNIGPEVKQDIYMTPELQMSIEILQYSALDLYDYIKEEIEKNPLLELGEEKDRSNFNLKGNNHSYHQDKLDFESFIGEKVSLREHLQQQLSFIVKGKEKRIGEYIIGNLDEKGFLDVSFSRISEKFNINVKKVKNIVEKIQYLDPPGIAAPNLKQSLLVQLKELSFPTEIAEKIVKKYLPELKARNFKKIYESLEYSSSEIEKAVAIIQKLNPRPAQAFNEGEDTQYMEPDILIKKVKNDYKIVMNEAPNSLLEINSFYYNLFQKSEKGELNKYLEDKYHSALWLMKSIEKRRVTIYKIAKFIVKNQEKFLEKGLKYVEPMTMEEAASVLDMHESTISRATSEKYIQTPWGIYELKYFFTSAVGNMSSISLKEIIKDIIDREDPGSPFSDNQISKKVRKIKDVDISRRTVAKYRNQMNIPSSRKRKVKY